MTTQPKRILGEAEKEEKRRIKAAKERARAQMAFSAILSTMGDIAREEVCHASIDLWRSRLNIFRKVGQTIKQKDFLVNADQGDPFNADAPNQRQLAEWFVEQWHRFKPGASTVHVRGLHYAISALADTPDAVYLPNGKVYDNTELRWQDLQRAGKYARYLGLIDPEIFQDRRSREAVTREFRPSYRSLHVTEEMFGFTYYGLPSFPSFPEFPDLPDFPRLPRYSLGLRGQQRYRLEVWIEKSTQEDVILPVCDRHQVTLVTAQGEISISSMWKAIKRAERHGDKTTTVILYISDFDPAGQSMPVAAARKLEFLRLLRRSQVNMRLYPIVLTHEQCVQYKLPRTPIKDTDDKRHGFQYRYGGGATELDALESLHPGELANLLEQAILRFRDDTISERVSEKWDEIAAELESIQSEVKEAHGMDELKEEFARVKEALVEIENAHYAYENTYDALEAEYDSEVRANFDEWHSEHFEPFYEKLHSAMRAVESDMQEKMPDIDEYEMPEAEEVHLDDDCLYDSTRDYVPQLAAYKQFAGKFSHLTPDEDEEEDIA